MRRILSRVVSVFLILIGISTSQAQSVGLDKVIAIVNDEAITFSEYLIPVSEITCTMYNPLFSGTEDLMNFSLVPISENLEVFTNLPPIV